MIAIKLSTVSKRAEAALNRLGDLLSPAKIDPVVHDVAIVTEGRLRRKTPKGFTGELRAAWQTVKPRDAVRTVLNPRRAMRYLEFGTRAHGPKDIYGPLRGQSLGVKQNRRLKALYVPLTRKGYLANRDFFAPTVRNGVIGTETRGIRTKRGKITNRFLKYGVDYVLPRRVRGIKAMKIAERERPLAAMRMKIAARDYIRSAVRR